LDDKIIEKLEKEYIEYQKNESWEIMENELTKYIESISISEIINFISALKEEVINTKLRHKDKLGEAIISIIF
jgi:hypothetical protein